MRNRSVWKSALATMGLAALVALSALRAVSASADSAPTMPAPKVEAPPPVVETPAPSPIPALEPMPPITDNPMMAYTLDIMNGWPKALPILPTVPYEEVAASIARVVHNADDASLLAALAYKEGARYAAYVDSGLCNDLAFMKTKEGQRLARWGRCDGGHAYSLFQIHPFTDKHAPLYDKCNKEAVTSSRESAAACALAIAHQSLARTGTLVDYTGEWRSPTNSHPLADERLQLARAAVRKHPYAYAKPAE
jgi:hypothetical protein